MKRFFRKASAIFMSVVMMLTIFAGTLNMSIKANAEGAPVFSLDKVSETDTEVKVSISLTSGEMRYITFILTHSDKISACTSIEKGETLKNVLVDYDNVMSSSNADTGYATVISVSAIDVTGVYFIFTFSKAVTDTIKDTDITAVEDEINAEIVNNLPGDKTEIELSESEITLYDGETKQLEATLTPATGETVTWTSSNESVATVVNGLVTAVDFGEAQITATTQSGTYAVCTVKVDMKLKNEANAEIEAESGLIFGSDIFGGTAETIKGLFENKNVTVSGNAEKVATGDTITFKKDNGDVYKTLTVVVFGDVNCDGIYDGTDTTIVNCLIGGMLTKAQVGDAVYTAADCNHDGVVDELDAGLLNEAGLLISSVSQAQA